MSKKQHIPDPQTEVTGVLKSQVTLSMTQGAQQVMKQSGALSQLGRKPMVLGAKNKVSAAHADEDSNEDLPVADSVQAPMPLELGSQQLAQLVAAQVSSSAGGVGAGVSGVALAEISGASVAASLGLAGVYSAATVLSIPAQLAVGTAGLIGAVSVADAVKGDEVAPHVMMTQSFSYAENSAANAVVGTVAATDNVAVTGFRFSATGTSTSADGFFSIGANGQVTITAAGVVAGVAQNDFETGANRFTYGIQARDAAGNWSSAVDVSLNVTDEPEVEALQTFEYTENRLANSFIGSVDATGKNGITGLRFWDPITQTSGIISTDGFFTIDSTGKIRMTALGAASFVNDAEDTQDVAGPKNIHSYFIQASDSDGVWSKPVEVTLNEGSCRCDDPDLQYLIDLATTGTVNRTLKDGRILSVTRNEFYEDVETDLGPVDPDKQIIRMISTGGADPGTNKVVFKTSLLDPLNTLDPARFLDDIACINLQASIRAELELNTMQTIYHDGDPVLADHFLPSLEKIYVSTQLNDSPQYAFSYLKFDNHGSYGWLPNLKDITVYAGGDSTRMNIYNNPVKYGTIPSDVLRGDDFMQSLETIYMESFGTVALNMTNYLGDAFMKSLTSITALGGSSGYGHTTLEFDNISEQGKGIVGDDGYTDGFMTALEVVTAKHQFGNAKIEFDNATSGPGGADNYMSSLSLIDIYSTTEEALYFRNGGGANYMGSLSEINMINSTRTAYFTATNTSRMDENTEVLRTADDFMTGLKSINIESEGRIDFRIKNEKGRYYLHNDNSTQYYSPTGDNFMSSLEKISLDASANNGSVRFEMLVDVQDNPTALAAMQTLSIKGGEISAIFDTSLDATSWLDFSNIQGLSDGQHDAIEFQGSWTNVLTVLGGFDTGAAVNDVIEFNVASWSGHNITGLNDLVFTEEGDNVHISFEESLGYEGSIILLGVASTFDENVNINFQVF